MNEKDPTKQHPASRFPTFRRIRQSLSMRRAPTGRGFELGKEEFKPGINYKFLSKKWKGPIYFSARNHRRDLQYVIGQFQSIVRANAPLASGIDAVAREERRTGSGNAFMKAFFITGWFLAGMLIAYFLVITTRFPGLAPLLAGLVFFVLAIYSLLQGNKTVALFHLIVVIICAVAFAAIAFVLDWNFLPPRYRYRYVEPQDVVLVLIIGAAVACFVINFRAALKHSGRELVLLRLRDMLQEGLDLSAAMRRLPRFFPLFYADMVEAGEQTGRMEACLAELSEDVGTDLTVQRQIRGTILYLCIVGVVQVFLMTFLMIKVVPVFFEIEKEFGTNSNVPFIFFVRDIFGFAMPGIGIRKLPHGVQEGLGSWAKYPSSTLITITLVFSIVFAVTLFLWRLYRKRRRGFSSRSLSSLFLLLPGFRSMVMQDNFTVITGTLEKLLCAGIPLDTALEKASVGDVNPVYARMLRRVHARVLEGESLVAAFQQASSGLLVPASFTSLVAVGEQSGMLPEALAYLHSFYRDQSSIRAHILVDTLKPFGVLLIGLVVLLFMKDMFTLLTGLTYAVLNSI